MEERFIREKKELAYHAHIFDVYNDYLMIGHWKCLPVVWIKGKHRNSVSDAN